MIFLKLDKMPLSEAYDDEIVQEANGKYQLSFKFPRKSDKWQFLTKETLLLADDLHGEQEFRIFEVVRRHGYVRVYANQVADDLNYKSITSISVDRVPGQTVMSALAGSIIQSHAFSFFSDISGRHSFNQSDVSVMKALSEGKHSIIGQWGGELVRDKYQVKLLERAGVDSEVLFMYKKNLSTFDQSESVKGLVTRLHLKKTIEENDNKSVIKTTVDSPLIGQYQLVYEANLEVQDQDVMTVEQLRQYGIDYFRKNLPDIPDNSLSIDVANSADYTVKLFDTAIVHYDLYDIDMRMQITSYKYSPQSKKLKSVGFGKIKTSLTQQIRQEQQAQNDKLESVISEQELKLQAEIDNANRHFDAEFDKRVEAINDDIEKAKADAEVYADTIRQGISQEFDTFEREYQANKAAQEQQVSDIRAQATDAKTLAQQAQQIGNQAKADAANSIAQALQYRAEAQKAGRDITKTNAELLATNEAIKELVTKSDFNAATGRLTNAETAITTQAGEIAKKLSRTEVENLVDNKGFATTANVQTLVTEAAGSFERQITETRGMIPTEVGSRNLLKGTKDLSGNDAKSCNTSDKYLDFNIARSRPTTRYHDTFTTYTTIPVTANDYILSFYAKSDVDGATLYCHFYEPNTTTRVESSTGYKGGSSDGLARVQVTTEWRRYWVKWTQRKTDTVKRVIIGRNNSADGIKTIEVAGIALYEGNLNKDWSPAPEDNDSAVQAVSTQVSQLKDSWSFKTLNSAGDILSQANLSSTQFLLEAAKIRLKGKTLADEIQAIDGKFNTLFVSDGTFGKLDATIIGAQAITGSQIKFDQAFFNNLMANDAYLKQLFAKSAFITQVQSVTMSANQISGGVMRALNNAMEIQMNNGQILYYTDQAALKRVLSGYPTQFVKFATGTSSGRRVGVTVIGSNRNGTESSNDGGFVGIRAWNGAQDDSIDVVGDTVRLASSAFDNSDGWDVITLPNRLEIDAHDVNHRVSSRMKVGDVWIWKNSTTYASLKDTINLIIDNLNLIHLNKTTEKGYNYTLPAKM